MSHHNFLTTRRIATGLVALCALVATAVFALPGPTACLAVSLLPLHGLADGALSDGTSAVDQQRQSALLREARSRISAAFGAPVSQPIVVFFSHAQGIGPFKLNSYGSTQFIGSRACVFMGPDGHTTDVLAHELMHSELHHRVGAWQRMVQIPTWFDEGLAMQVDHRSRYDLSPQAAQTADAVRSLSTMSAFSRGDEPTVVYHYAAAKATVAALLAKADPASLYARLARMREGASFDLAFTP
jgi:hypothetical protein